MLKHIILFIKKNFLWINWYEAENTKKNIKIKKGNFKFVVFKSKKDIFKTNINLKEYFEKYRDKLKRFDKKYYFLALTNKKKLLSSLWICFGKKFYISEIDLNIKLKHQYLITDGETPKDLRGRGYFSLIMKLARVKFKNKKVVVFVLSNNLKSEQGIKKSGFKFVKKIYGY